MYQDERFVAASAEFDALAALYLKVKGVIGVAVQEAPDTDKRNPGGPQFVVYVKDRSEVDDKRRTGQLPTEIKTKYDVVDILVTEGEFTSDDAHTQNENPMHPGASISDGIVPPGTYGSVGTLGAALASPANHFLTCGHCVEAIGRSVYQAGLGDSRKARRPDRPVGKVAANSLLAGTSDSATVELSPGFVVNSMPHDSPPPSSATPAIGLYRGRMNDRPFYVHIDDALAACGASMTYTTRMTPLDKGKRVKASGRTSGYIESIIDGVATFNDNGVTTLGFICERAQGATAGDSGAVSVVQRGQSTTWVSDLGQTDITSTDVDDPAEYLPGTFGELDKFLSSDGSNIAANGTPMPQADGRNLISRIIARLRQLGELEVVVTANSFYNPCRKDGRRSRRPTNCHEIILRPGREIEEPDEDPSLIEEIESETECCTFGARPYVTIAGDDSETTDFELSVSGAAAIRVEFTVSQTVMSARFLRHGSCFRNICDDEEIRGTVVLSRTTKLAITGSLGEVDLPFIGPIKAGSGSFKREVTRSLRRSFKLSCKGPS